MTERRTIDEMLDAARARIERVEPAQLADEMANGALVVDTRCAAQREADGELDGAVVIERNVLEWRLDPASDAKIAQVDGYDTRVIVVCNEGFASSLVAATLQDLGLHRATDLAGGYQALRVARD